MKKNQGPRLETWLMRRNRVLRGVGKDSAPDYSALHLSYTVLGVEVTLFEGSNTIRVTVSLSSDKLDVTVTTPFISRTGHPHVTRYVLRTIMHTTVLDSLLIPTPLTESLLHQQCLYK